MSIMIKMNDETKGLIEELIKRIEELEAEYKRIRELLDKGEIVEVHETLNHILEKDIELQSEIRNMLRTML